jgi:hypothetical protein
LPSQTGSIEQRDSLDGFISIFVTIQAFERKRLSRSLPSFNFNMILSANTFFSDQGNDTTVSNGDGGGNTSPKPHPSDPSEIIHLFELIALPTALDIGKW